MKITTTLLSTFLAALPLSSLADEVLVKENFDDTSVGPVYVGRFPHIIAWEGRSEAEFGRFEITDTFPGSESAAAGRDRLNVIAINDNSPDRDKSPSLVFPWDDRAPQSGRLVVSWDFMVPAGSPYLGIHFFGNHWTNSSAAILLSNGRVILHADKGDASRLRVGSYTPGTWHAIKAELDIDARTLDLWLDGKKVANAVPWLATAPKAPGRLSTVAELSATDHAGAAVLYLDNIQAVAVPSK